MESDRLAGHPRQPAGDPDRGLYPVCIPLISAGGGRPTARAQARHCGVRRSRGHGGDTAWGATSAVPGNRPARPEPSSPGEPAAGGPCRRAGPGGAARLQPGDGTLEGGGLGWLWGGTGHAATAPGGVESTPRWRLAPHATVPGMPSATAAVTWWSVWGWLEPDAPTSAMAQAAFINDPFCKEYGHGGTQCGWYLRHDGPGRRGGAHARPRGIPRQACL